MKLTQNYIFLDQFLIVNLHQILQMKLTGQLISLKLLPVFLNIIVLELLKLLVLKFI